MNLNLDIIGDNLPKMYQARRYGPKNRKLLFSHPRPYKVGSQMNPECLYIAPSNELPPTAPKSTGIICVGGKVPQSLMSSEMQVLHLAGCSDVTVATHEVLAIYDKFDLWDSRLRDELENIDDFDIRRILRTVFEVLDNHIGISNQTLQNVALCETDQATGTTRVMLKEELTSIWTDLDLAAALRSVCLVERKVTSPYLTIMPNLEYEAYCSNVYLHGRFIGCLYICGSNHAFRESDFPLADRCFEYLKKAYLRYLLTDTDTDSLVADTMVNLLERRAVSPLDIAPFKRQDSEYWLCLKLREKRNAHSLPTDYMCNAICSIMPDKTCAIIHNGGILGLLLIDNDKPEVYQSYLNTLNELLSSMGYICGLSNAFMEISLMADYMLQANYAIESAPHEDAERLIYDFNDFSLQYLVDEYTSKLPAQSFYSKGLLLLIEHDNEKGTEYIRTLDVYLKSETNASRAAEELFIHRNSLIKRLDNIWKILDMDFEDPMVRMYLRVSMLMMEEASL